METATIECELCGGTAHFVAVHGFLVQYCCESCNNDLLIEPVEEPRKTQVSKPFTLDDIDIVQVMWKPY